MSQQFVEQTFDGIIYRAELDFPSDSWRVTAYGKFEGQKFGMSHTFRSVDIDDEVAGVPDFTTRAHAAIKLGAEFIGPRMELKRKQERARKYGHKVTDPFSGVEYYEYAEDDKHPIDDGDWDPDLLNALAEEHPLVTRRHAEEFAERERLEAALEARRQEEERERERIQREIEERELATKEMESNELWGAF
jgi:hypothetical protein